MKEINITDLYGQAHNIDLDNLGNQAFCMDCMELMKALPDKCFELAIVDPPYGLLESGGQTGGEKGIMENRMFRRSNIAGWDKKPPKSILMNCFGYLKIKLYGAETILHYQQIGAFWFGTRCNRGIRFRCVNTHGHLLYHPQNYSNMITEQGGKYTQHKSRLNYTNGNSYITPTKATAFLTHTSAHNPPESRHGKPNMTSSAQKSTRTITSKGASGTNHTPVSTN